MLNYRIAFDNPWLLCLLGLLPLLWWSSFRTLSGLGRWRRYSALTLRTVVLVLMILALAEAQLVRTSDRLTVLYLLDQSLSVPEAQRSEMIKFVNGSIKLHRDKEDLAGVIVFGRDAAVEIPPIDEHVPVPKEIESLLEGEYTDLAGAMKLALALFPHDAAKRVVVVTDGNENLGDARTQAQALVDAGVSIDVVPIPLAARGEVAVEKLTAPSDVRGSQPFDLRVVLDNSTDPAAGEDGTIPGKLRIVRRGGGREDVRAEQDVVLPLGKKVLTMREQIDEPDFYTYEARFIPDDPADDALAQNNRATAFTQVRGRGHVLLIEDWAHKGEFDPLVDALKREQLEVTVMPSNQLFTNLSELQRFDTVVLANVPRSSGEDVDADRMANFSDDQISMLTRNTQQMGAGLVMLGGPNSFGAGGWSNTELEKAMPVDFQIKNAKVVPVGALAMLMHASEIAQGNHWQKVVAGEALKTLGPQDYCGLIHWVNTDEWLWKEQGRGMLQVGPRRRAMLSKLDRMTPGDMPQFDPAMQLAAAEFAQLPDAAVKHMIIISDGDPSPPKNSTIAALAKQGVKISTVAIGAHGPPGSTPLQKIATDTGGKYYVVNNARALPRIYQREARRVSRPLVKEDPNGIQPQVKLSHEMIKGLEGQIPPITGFVLTSKKESPLVEVALVAPIPEGEMYSTILASWTYGLGKSVVLTTDAGTRWASAWTGWENYDKLFSQIIRWSMRPGDDSGKFSLAIDAQEGKGRVVVTALDTEDEFLNFLDMSGTVVGPDMKPIDMTIRQTAPGRYLGEFEAPDSGSYFVVVSPGPGRAPLRGGMNVPYSDEFRDHETNVALLEHIAELAPEGGTAGKMIGPPAGGADLTQLLAVNPFRRDLPKSTASEDVWHLLVLMAGCVFFVDVLNRRVHVSFAWLPPLVSKTRDKLFRRQTVPAESQTMDRLRSRKAAVDEHIEEKRRAARFEPTAADTAVLEPYETPGEPKPAAQPGSSEIAPEPEEESYTERLLKAKKKVWEHRKPQKSDEDSP